MAEESFKIRFRFPGGEEFEAEGNREFIEQQQNYFLKLIGKNNLLAHANAEIVQPRCPNALSSVPKLGNKENISHPKDSYGQSLPELSILPPSQRPQQHNEPSVERGEIVNDTGNFPALRLWERLLKEDGDLVFLRKKVHIEASQAALILLAGTRVLLKKPSCLALNLSRSMKKSGFSEGRLDRLLMPEIKKGLLSSEGNKRGRTYRLTNEGFAKAFVLAEKLGSTIP